MTKLILKNFLLGAVLLSDHVFEEVAPTGFVIAQPMSFFAVA
jgi:hypothetical protein